MSATLCYADITSLWLIDCVTKTSNSLSLSNITCLKFRINLNFKKYHYLKTISLLSSLLLKINTHRLPSKMGQAALGPAC